jgi:hypothetical protein
MKLLGEITTRSDSLRPFVTFFAAKGLSVHAKAQFRREMSPRLGVENGQAQQLFPTHIN